METAYIVRSQSQVRAVLLPETNEFEGDRVIPGSTLLGLCHGFLVVEEESGLVRLVRE